MWGMGVSMFTDQYCNCLEHSIILVEQMEVKQGYLYCNRKLNIGSTFPLEVLPTDRIKAIKPCHIVKKCIRIDFGDKTFFLAITILHTGKFVGCAEYIRRGVWLCCANFGTALSNFLALLAWRGMVWGLWAFGAELCNDFIGLLY